MLVIPTVSVVTGQAGTYVWVMDSSNKAQERPVVVERAAGGYLRHHLRTYRLVSAL